MKRPKPSSVPDKPVPPPSPPALFPCVHSTNVVLQKILEELAEVKQMVAALHPPKAAEEEDKYNRLARVVNEPFST